MQIAYMCVIGTADSKCLIVTAHSRCIIVAADGKCVIVKKLWQVCHSDS